MTLKSLTRTWINETFDNGTFNINSKHISYGEKGIVVVFLTLTANDCLYIATDKKFSVEYTIKFQDNKITDISFCAWKLSTTELRELNCAL
jgi:hypothetical protein